MLTKDLNDNIISIEIYYDDFKTRIQWDYDNECFYGSFDGYSNSKKCLFASYQGYTFEEAVEAFKIAVDEIKDDYD
jgi:predicted RNase H-like HicB family nuclease